MWSDPVAIKVTPGDPIIDLEIQTLQGQKLRLDQAIDSSFCFILGTSCKRCEEALINIQRMIVGKHHVAMLFPESPVKVREFAAKHADLLEGVEIYAVDPQQLEPYNIKIVPALLCYSQSRLTLAFHGIINPKYTQMLLSAYESRQTGKQGGSP